MTWVKICGTTNLADAQSAIAAGADALGFVFAPSPRQVTQAAAAGIIDALPANVRKIGVVVNESPENLSKLAETVGLTGVQLHGDEPSDQLWAYRSALGPRMIIKTLQASALLAEGDHYLYSYLRVSEFFDAVLVDAGSPAQRGGAGMPFDWNAVMPLVSRIKETMPVIVAGGLSPENVADAVRRFTPWGVDVASGVESAAGKKDESKLRTFIQAVRGAGAPVGVLQTNRSLTPSQRG
jgi:phosphoribosylanthranilate isomerase